MKDGAEPRLGKGEAGDQTWKETQTRSGEHYGERRGVLGSVEPRGSHQEQPGKDLAPEEDQGPGKNRDGMCQALGRVFTQAVPDG